MCSLLIGCADSGKEFSSSGMEFATESLSLNQTSIKKKVDILFVIDNSTSMDQDRKILGAQFQNFISSIDKADYRIGFINTDVTAKGYENVSGFHGNLRLLDSRKNIYIDSNTPNATALFEKFIKEQAQPVCDSNGACDEQPMRAIMMAVAKRKTVNSSFFREDASFVSIIVTDEDEMSTGGSAATQPLEMLRYLSDELSAGLDNYSSFVIAIPPQDKDCLTAQKKASKSGTGAYPANLLWKLTGFIDGFNVSLCDSRFGDEIARVSEYMESKLLVKSVQLDHAPASKKSIKVMIFDKYGKKINIKWQLVSGSRIVFNQAPPEGSTISVEYDRKK